MLREALYEGLFEIKSDFTLENELCEDYTSDGTTFSFTIKKGIKFWSGAELTASDVAESLKTVLENESSPYHNRLTEVSSIEAVTKRMVRITLASPNVNFRNCWIFRSIGRVRRTKESSQRAPDRTSRFRTAPHGRWRPTRIGTAAFSAPFATLRWSK